MAEEQGKPNLTGIPAQPGCYLMKSEAGKTVYIGKAINLRSRVRSYFRKAAKHSPRIALMVSLVRHIDFIVTKNEVEALILENILIKKERPRFNVMLRDDKTYPYLKITKEKFPRLTIVRRVLKDGALYFGPYVSATAIRSVRKLIHKVFPLRESKDNLNKAPHRRPCLNYQMKKCLAPCAGLVTEQQYQQMIEGAIKIVKGKDSQLMQELKTKMKQSSAEENFEQAAIYRDQLQAIEAIKTKQEIDAAKQMDEDYIAGVMEGGNGVVRIMMVRNGKLMGDQNFIFKKVDDLSEMLSAFIKQFYSQAFSIPSQIICNHKPDDETAIIKWLTSERAKKVAILLPERGRKVALLKMAKENAKLKLMEQSAGQEARKEALTEIKNILGLPELPMIMECVDISNTLGFDAVGSLVQMKNGEENRSGYKRYKMKTKGQDDYAMIAELVGRRFKRLSEEGGKFPDLLVVDGGAGQLRSAADAAQVYKKNQRVVGIAKGGEREKVETDLFLTPESNTPLPFPPTSAGRFMLQRLRDESHRFAINYHRQKRQKSGFASAVDDVKGFGPKRKKLLIKKYGSLKAAKEKTVKEVAKLLSIPLTLATEILEKI